MKEAFKRKTLKKRSYRRVPKGVITRETQLRDPKRVITRNYVFRLYFRVITPFPPRYYAFRTLQERFLSKITLF